MYKLQVKGHFDAAHYIKDYRGKCSRMHGHRWEVVVVLAGSELGPMNMLVDFSWVKKRLGVLLEGLDHYVLNEQLPKLTQYGEADNVTAEYLARWIYQCFEVFMAHPDLPSGLKLARVAVWENPECCVSYDGKES